MGYDDYDAWGYILPGRSLATGTSTVAGAAKNKFTGKVGVQRRSGSCRKWDDELGLKWYYFGARYYDPEVGRWLAPDPLGEKHPNFTPYNYTLNNPLLFVDPDGRQVSFSELFKFALRRDKTIAGRLFRAEERGQLGPALRMETANAFRELSNLADKGEDVALGGAFVTAFTPAAAVSLKVAGTLGLVSLGSDLVATAIDPSQESFANLLRASGFQLTTTLIEIGLRKIPGGKFAGKLSEKELTALVAKLEPALKTLEHATEQEINQFFKEQIVKFLESKNAEQGEREKTNDQEKENTQ